MVRCGARVVTRVEAYGKPAYNGSMWHMTGGPRCSRYRCPRPTHTLPLLCVHECRRESIPPCVVLVGGQSICSMKTTR